MCRNIKTLFNFEPPATDDEIRAASLQFVRKLSGFNSPSQANQAAFDQAIEEVTAAASDADRFAGHQRRSARPRSRSAARQGPQRGAFPAAQVTRLPSCRRGNRPPRRRCPVVS